MNKLIDRSLQKVHEKLAYNSEIIAKTHNIFANRVVQEVEQPLQQYLEVQKRLRASYEQEFDRLNKAIAKELANIEKCKKDYTLKGTELTKAIQIAGKGQTDNMTKKEYEKIQEKAIKSKKDLDAAEQEYKAALKKYDAAQDQYDEKLNEFAKEVQKLEAERLAVSQASLNKIMDSQLELLGNITQGCFQKMKENLNLLTPAEDLTLYLAQHKTSSSKPARPAFQSFFGNNPGTGRRHLSSANRSSSNLATNSNPGSSNDLDKGSRYNSSDALKDVARNNLVRSKSQVDGKNMADGKSNEATPPVPMLPRSPLSSSSISNQRFNGNGSDGDVAKSSLDNEASPKTPTNDANSTKVNKKDSLGDLSVETKKAQRTEDSYGAAQSHTVQGNAVAKSDENLEKATVASPDSGFVSPGVSEATRSKEHSASNLASSGSFSSLTDLAPGTVEALKKRVFARRSIKMEGWLEVCENNSSQWAKRWCSLEGGYIWFFENQSDNAKVPGAAKPKSMLSVSKGIVKRGLNTSGWSAPTHGSANIDSLAFTLTISKCLSLIL